MAHPIKKAALAVLLSSSLLFGASAGFAHADHAHENQLPEKPVQTETGFWADLLVIKESDLAAFGDLGDGGPDILILDTAKRGDVIALKLIFTGMTLRPNQSADVSFDISITRPDGELYGGAAHKGVEALKQPVFERDRIFNSGATLVIGFEPEDPLGVYHIKMTVNDNVGGHQLLLTETITLVDDNAG